MQHYTKNNQVIGREYEPEKHDALVADGWLAITIDEARAITTPAPVPLTPLQQIRAMEQTQNVRDAMERASRLAALVTTRTEMVRQQAARVPAVIVTHDQVHAWLVVNDKYYKLLWELEQLIEPLRKQVV